MTLRPAPRAIVPTSIVAAVLLPITFVQADVRSAPCGRYVVDADTVKDTKTGLTWQRTIDTNVYDWSQALQYCRDLAGAGGGWRLPTYWELQSIIDETRTNPAIDVDVFPGTPSIYFWTSSPYVGDSSGAWVVAFSDGITFYDDVTLAWRARCVR